MIVYVLAINFYAFLFMKNLRKVKPDQQKKYDGKLSLIALLGGGPTIYACMFIFKNRLDNLFFMVAVPVLTALHVYIWFFGLRYGFGIPRWR